MRAVKRCPLSALYDAERKSAEKHRKLKSSTAGKTKTKKNIFELNSIKKMLYLPNINFGLGYRKVPKKQ